MVSELLGRSERKACHSQPHLQHLQHMGVLTSTSPSVSTSFSSRLPTPFCSSRTSLSFKKRLHNISFSVGAQQIAISTVISTAPVAGSMELQDTDLLVVGPGVLGKLIAQGWMKKNVGCKVVGQSRTTDHHNELRSLGILPTVKNPESKDLFPYVVFCAPPSANEDYIGEVRSAIERWDGRGTLLFTSSSAVYDCDNNGICNESNQIILKGKSPRVDRLLDAEDEVIKAGGNVVRLAGLYTLDRGPHAYWLKLGKCDIRPDHILNLIHYEDAASLCVAILQKKDQARTYLGCDGHPLSRQEIMDIVKASGKFEFTFQGFGTEGPLGKQLDNSVTRAELCWKPQYKSFSDCLGVTFKDYSENVSNQ